MSHGFLVCGFLDGRPVLFYDLFVEPFLLCRVCLLLWLAGSNRHLQSAEELDQWDPFSKHPPPNPIYPVPKTILGFKELYSSYQWREVLRRVRAAHTISTVC